ncbi:MAG: RIP metalloprotease RseP [Akkermansiaceae bacterium]
MDSLLNILKVIGLILLVLLSFNIIIFVHELGHFLAARWRGLHVDRFQIWFGKPIWKKTINGVQYGLGSIPAGGFVALPQMAPMESIEGDNGERKEPLPPIKPIDKIIVAFAGPLFSFLLAVFAACIIWIIGVPDKVIKTNEVGYIAPDMPAAEAGFKLGDKILKIQDTPVNGFQGNLDSVRELIIFSEGDEINFLVDRDGEEITLTSKFEAEGGTLTQRRGTRQVGIGYRDILKLGPIKKDTPASLSGMKEGDIIDAVNGEEIYSYAQFSELIKAQSEKLFILTVLRNEKPVEIKTMALAPSNGWKRHDDAELLPMLGVGFTYDPPVLVYPTPGTQLKESGMMMFTTISKLTSSSSSIGLDQLSGPVGIGKVQYQLLDSDYPINYIFYFWVIFNINLAIFNLLPFPVLDGGHITMALGEMIFKKPINTRVLEYVQTGFVLLLLSMFFYVTTKDVFHKDKKYTTETIPKEGPTFDLTPLEKALSK